MRFCFCGADFDGRSLRAAGGRDQTGLRAVLCLRHSVANRDAALGKPGFG